MQRGASFHDAADNERRACANPLLHYVTAAYTATTASAASHFSNARRLGVASDGRSEKVWE